MCGIYWRLHARRYENSKRKAVLDWLSTLSVPQYSYLTHVPSLRNIQSPDGNLTASGHHSGAIYIFSNATGRLLHSLASLSRPVRTVKFSPAGKLLATAGDSGVVALYDVKSGEQVANLAGHGGAWVFSLDWSSTGEFLLSGAFDGKAKIWNVERRVCVATHTESEKTIWGVKWLPKTGRNELFAVAGAGKSISFYREATGG
jgi:superkiller protein 8